MKTLTKTLLSIVAFFGAILGWHAVMPLSICWLTELQIGLCVICEIATVGAAVIVFVGESL